MGAGDHSDWATSEHALAYLARADGLPHRAEGEGVVLELLPPEGGRMLDLGTGDGRLLALARLARPEAGGIALDFSEPMLEAARERFAHDQHVDVVHHDLARPLPDLGTFDVVLSSFAIHHLEDDRKRTLYDVDCFWKWREMALLAGTRPD